MWLDVLVQKRNGRVERVVLASLISFCYEGSNYIGERVVIIPDITSRDVLFSGVVKFVEF